MPARDPYEYPKLRWPLDVRPQEIDGKRILVLSCPLGIAECPLGLVAQVGGILGEFQGVLSVAQIDAKLKQYGSTPEIIRELIKLLDDSLFLDSPRFAAASEKVKKEFIAAPDRAPYLAGLSYNLERGELEKEIDRLLAHGTKNFVPKLEKTTMLGLMSPHIDYRRGGVCYGITWSQIREHEHDLYLLAGTSHQYSELMFHLTKKDFLSPLGTLPTDKDLIEGVSKRYGPRSFADEFLHRREHSLELQTPFLKRLKNKPAIAPILVGSFHRMLVSGKRPSEFEIYEDFVGALGEELKARVASGTRVCFVAGVDMAHVGQTFGDKDPLTPEFMAEIEARDRIYLRTILEQDKEKLWSHIAEDHDRRRICGFPTMYMMLDLFERLNVRYKPVLFDYRQAVDYKTQCAVTFAGMGMYH